MPEGNSNLEVQEKVKRWLEEGILDRLRQEEASLSQVIGELKALSKESRQSALSLLAKEAKEKVVPLLKTLGRAEELDLALLALDTIGSMGTERSALALMEIAKTSPNKAVRKAARRLLYRLKISGVNIESLTEKIVPQEKPIESRPKIYKAYVSNIDGEGTRIVWMTIERTLDYIRLVILILNDLKGIVALGGKEMIKKRLERERMKFTEGENIVLIEIPPSYARYLVGESRKRNEVSGYQLPEEYNRWKEVIEEPEFSFDQPLIYKELNPDKIKEDIFLLSRSNELLKDPLFASWFFPPDEVRSYALELLEARESRLILSPEVKTERKARIVDKVIEGIFGVERRAIFKRRLEEMAHILLRCGKEEEAKQALAAALALTEDEDLKKHPFIQAIVIKSLEIAIKTGLGKR